MEKPCGSIKRCIFAAAIGYLARAVRDRSAKPGTAVRVRQVPHKPAEVQRAFLLACHEDYIKQKESQNWNSFVLSHMSDSNQRPTHYECVALPTELKWPLKCGCKNRNNFETRVKKQEKTFLLKNTIFKLKF